MVLEVQVGLLVHICPGSTSRPSVRQLDTA